MAKRLQLVCALCGKSFERLESQNKNGPSGRTFCSKACFYEYDRCRRKKTPIPCKACGKLFEPKSAKTEYCSRKCFGLISRGRPRVERVTLSCAACGKPVERRKTDMERNKTGRVFCSRECMDKVGSKPRKKKNRVCPGCGKEFYPQNDSIVCCSVECANAVKKRTRKQVCVVCGKEFDCDHYMQKDRIIHRKDGSQYMRHARKYCSQACKGVATWKRVLPRSHNGKPARLNQYGYVLVWEPSRSPHKRWVTEHRVVMANMIGRPLTSDEEVHHINRDKTDNRPENLQLIEASEHGALSSEMARRDRKELKRYRELYGPLQ